MEDAIKKALEDFCEVIEACGGVVKNGTLYEPIGDSNWSDLGDAYIVACKALGRKPVVEEEV